MHEKAEYFRELWERHGKFLSPHELTRTALSPEQQDEIGLAYLSHIIGATKKQTADFIPYRAPVVPIDASIPFNHKRHESAWSGLGGKIYHYSGKNDIKGFWNAVAQIAPHLHSASDLSWLKENDDAQWAYMIVTALQMSAVTHEIVSAGATHHFGSCVLVGCPT